MWKRLLGCAIAVLVVCWVPACGSDACSLLSEPYCDGQTAWICQGGGDKGPFRWYSQKCAPEHQQCIKGQCVSEMLGPCPKERVDQQGCTPDGLNVAWCTEVGTSGTSSWSWASSCDPKLNAVCEELVVNEGYKKGLQVGCVLTSHEPCAQEFASTCRDNVRLQCSSLGLWGWPRDCAAKGLVCFAGECVEGH